MTYSNYVKFWCSKDTVIGVQEQQPWQELCHLYQNITLPCSKVTGPWRTNIVSLRWFSKGCGFQTLCSLLGPPEGRKGFTKTTLTFLTLCVCVLIDHHYKFFIFKNLICVFSFKQSFFYLTRHNIFGKSSRGTPVGRWKPPDNEPWRRLLKWSEGRWSHTTVRELWRTFCECLAIVFVHWFMAHVCVYWRARVRAVYVCTYRRPQESTLRQLSHETKKTGEGLMVQWTCHRAVMVEDRVQSQASPCWIWGAISGAWRCFYPRTLASAVSMPAPMLHTHYFIYAI